MIKTLIIFSFLTIIVLYCYPQERGKSFITNFKPSEYKAHSQNWGVIQDKRGIMYFANGDGILEYDGVKWRLTELKNKIGLRSLALDSSGRIYIGANSDFGYLEPDKNGSIQFISFAEKLKVEYRKINDIWQILIFNNSVFFRSYDKLYCYHNDTVKLWSFQSRLQQLFTFNDKLFLLNQENGLIEIQNDSLIYFKNALQNKNILTNFVKQIDNKRIIIISSNSGLNWYFPKTDVLIPLHTEIDSILFRNNPYCGFIKDNEIYIGCIGMGLFVIDFNGKLITKIDKKTGLNDLSIYSIIQDNDGNIWTSLNNGISRISINIPLTYFNEFDGITGAIEDIVRFKGTLYVATHNGFYYFKNNEIIKIQEINKQCWKFCIFNDPDNPKNENLVAGSSNSIFEIRNFQLIPIKIFNAFRKATFELYQSKTEPHRLYYGTTESLGSLWYDHGKWINEFENSTISENVRSIYEDCDSNLWLTTFRNGVFRTKTLKEFNKNPTIQFTTYKKEKGFLSMKNILVFPFQNRLIFGSECGLYKYDKLKDCFIPDSSLGVQYSGGNKDVFSFIEAYNGNVYLSGLNNRKSPPCIIFKENGQLTYFTTPFMVIPEMMTLGFYVENDSTVWIGGNEGLFKYNPDVKFDFNSIFPTMIRKVTIENDSVIFNGVFEKQTLKGKEICIEQPKDKIFTLKYQNNRIKIEYAALYYQNEKATQYSVMLEGFDTSWSNWNFDIYKEYINLPFGKYTFKVKALNINNIESSIGVYKFIILPPWYRTWWAYLLFIILIVFAIYNIVKFYTLRLIKQKNRLEQIVKERTHEISEKNTELETQKDEILNQKKEIEDQRDELEQSNNNIQKLSEIGKKIIHNLDIVKIVDTVYQQVNQLMDATIFVIGILQAEKRGIMNFAKDDNVTLEPYLFELEDKNRMAVICLEQKAEILIGDMDVEYTRYLKKRKKPVSGNYVSSLIYLPLLTKNDCIGTISVQSYRKKSYNENHLYLLRAIAVYTAIAIENAEAYLKIDQQKTEIEKAKKNIEMLSEIGKKITAHLTFKGIEEIVYENLNQLMDATVFSIGIYNDDLKRLDYYGGKEEGKTMPFRFYELSDKNRIASLCFINQIEIFSNDYETDRNKYIQQYVFPKAGKATRSLIYLPLNLKDKNVGVITVQSYNKNAYSQNHLNYLRNIAVYTAIALENTNNYREIEEQRNDIITKNKELEQQKEEIQSQSDALELKSALLETANKELKNKEAVLEISNKKLKENENNILEKNKTLEMQKMELQIQAEQLQLAYNKLQELDRFKEGLTSMIVHDLKNPLNQILNVSRSYPPTIQMEITQQSGKQMLNMVLNILDVHKYEDMHMTVDLIDKQFIIIALNAINQIRFLCKQKDITIKNLIEPSLIAKVDEEIIERVMVNLLTNAIKYTPTGGEITINYELGVKSKVKSERNEEVNSNVGSPLTTHHSPFIIIKVSDTGEGIPEDKLHLVFQKFGQIVARKSGAVRSTGLGLTFCKMAVEAHDGQIGLNSVVGKGTTFWFTLNIGNTQNITLQSIEQEAVIEKEILIFNNSDKLILEPYINQLKAFTIYETDDVEEIIRQIRPLANENIKKWITELEKQLVTLNQTKYLEILDA